MPRVLFGVTVAMTAQAFLRDQMMALASDGWDVHLACSANDGTDAFAKLQGIQGITLHDLPMARPPRPVSDLNSLLQWLRLIKTVNPDIVVASTPKAGLLGTLAARMSRVPVRVYHIRGLRSEGLSGILARVSRASERLAIWSATHVLLDGLSLREAMRADRLLPDNMGTVLGQGSCCGVDTLWFRPPSNDERLKARADLGLQEDEIVIGLISRLNRDKGIRELITATHELHLADTRVRLLLVGPIEDDEIRTDIAALLGAHWLVAPGLTTDPRSSYWALDIFCLPSYREGFPIAPLEAQACALPVVTTEATGCIDSIEPEVTGLLVPVRNVPALRDALARVTHDRALRVHMGQMARDRAIRDFERTAVCSRVVGFIKQAAQGLPRQN